MGTSLLPTEGQQLNSAAESFYTANARKFGILVVLLFIGSLALGAKVYLGFEEPSMDISVLTSSYEVSVANLDLCHSVYTVVRISVVGLGVSALSITPGKVTSSAYASPRTEQLISAHDCTCLGKLGSSCFCICCGQLLSVGAGECRRCMKMASQRIACWALKTC